MTRFLRRLRNLTTLKCLAPALVFTVLAEGAAAQTADCELLLMPAGGTKTDAQFVNANEFLDSVYDDQRDHRLSIGALAVRAVMCQRADVVPSMRDFPILKTGLSLALSDNFDDQSGRLLTIYDAGNEFKAEYSGPKLSQETEARLRDTLEIFNFQKLAGQ